MAYWYSKRDYYAYTYLTDTVVSLQKLIALDIHCYNDYFCLILLSSPSNLELAVVLNNNLSWVTVTVIDYRYSICLLPFQVLHVDCDMCLINWWKYTPVGEGVIVSATFLYLKKGSELGWKLTVTTYRVL